MSNSVGIKLREADLSDLVPIFSFIKELELLNLTSQDLFYSKWTKFWQENPVLVKNISKLSLGWILEYNNKIVGFFGSIPRLYRFGNRDLLVSIASTWAVEKHFRTHTNLLSTAYFSQKNIDLFMVTTAIKPTARIFARFSGQPVPRADYDNVLFWVIKPAGFLNSVFRKLKMKPFIADFLGKALSPFLYALIALKTKSCNPDSGRKQMEVEKENIDEIGAEFDALWQRKINEEQCLYAYRTAEYLRWSLEICIKTKQVFLFCCRRENRLDGYIILTIEYVTEISMKRGKIMDLFVAGDDLAVVDALFLAVFNAAREQGCHILELAGFSMKIRKNFLKYRPFIRRYESYNYHYKTMSDNMKLLLENPKSWYLALFDGDSAFS